MKNTLLTIVLLVCAALIVSALVSSAVNSFEAACESGDGDPALCKVAEISGLFDEPTPAVAAEEAR